MPITDEGVAKGKYKVCLDYHLGKCAGPCVGRMSEAEYGAQIEAIVQILKGNSWSLIKEFRGGATVEGEDGTVGEALCQVSNR